MHPDFPVVKGFQRLTSDWALTLPEAFNRRIQDEDLVFWRTGFTVYIAIWNNDRNETVRERLEWLRAGHSPDAFAIEEESDGDLLRMCYRLTEGGDGRVVHALYGFIIGQNSHVQMAAYFDDETELQTAKRIWRSFAETA